MTCENHSLIENRVKSLEKITDRQESEIKELKETSSANRVMFDNIFSELKAIKDILAKNSERLPTFIYSVGGIILGGVVVWLITR